MYEKTPYPIPPLSLFAPRYILQGRWSGTLGTPRALTWSLMPDGVNVDAQPNELFARMDSLFRNRGGRAVWIGLLQNCLDRWASIAGLSYTRVTYNGNDWDDGAAFGTSGSLTRGDIRIAMTVQDGPGMVLAYNYYPPHGDMVLDRDETWNDSSGNYLFLRNTVMHEHGHGLGLRHVCPRNYTKLMEPAIAMGYEGPQHDDIRAAQANYGDRFEPNNTAASATGLGGLAAGGTLSPGAPGAPAVPNSSLVSLHNDSDEDWFRFELAGPARVTINLSPIGTTYDSSNQNGDGSCNSGNLIDSLSQADLSVEVRAMDGLTVLYDSRSRPAGVNEYLPNRLLLTGGLYYLRVFGESTFAQSQLYSLTIANLDCNHNGVSDAVDLIAGTSSDCDGDAIPDECVAAAGDTNHNQKPDVCEKRRGDFDLDGDVDMCDFARLQRCLTGPYLPQANPACNGTDLDGSATVDSTDVAIFTRCLSGADRPYDPHCN